MHCPHQGPAGEKSPAGGVCKTSTRDPTRVSFTHWPVQGVPTLSYVFSAHPLSPLLSNSTEVQNHSWQLAYKWKEEEKRVHTLPGSTPLLLNPVLGGGSLQLWMSWKLCYYIRRALILELVTQYDHGISITSEVLKNSLDLPRWKHLKGTQRDQRKWLWLTPDVSCMFNILVALTWVNTAIRRFT